MCKSQPLQQGQNLDVVLTLGNGWSENIFKALGDLGAYI